VTTINGAHLSNSGCAIRKGLPVVCVLVPCQTGQEYKHILTRETIAQVQCEECLRVMCFIYTFIH